MNWFLLLGLGQKEIPFGDWFLHEFLNEDEGFVVFCIFWDLCYNPASAGINKRQTKHSYKWWPWEEGFSLGKPFHQRQNPLLKPRIPPFPVHCCLWSLPSSGLRRGQSSSVDCFSCLVCMVLRWPQLRRFSSASSWVPAGRVKDSPPCFRIPLWSALCWNKLFTHLSLSLEEGLASIIYGFLVPLQR